MIYFLPSLVIPFLGKEYAFVSASQCLYARNYSVPLFLTSPAITTFVASIGIVEG
jgi:hypothetical protein